MATNLMDTAKALNTDVDALVERLSQSQTVIADLLSAVKLSEASLLEKEETARRERQEFLRKERLREMLASDKDLAVHVGGADEVEEAEVAAPAETTPESADKAEKEVPAVPESTVFVPDMPSPAEKKAGGYEARPIPQQQQRPRPAQPGGQTASPARPPQRSGGYQARPIGQQQGSFAPRPAGPGKPGAPTPAPAAGGKERVSNYDPNRGAYTRSYDSNKKTKNKKAIDPLRR